MIADVMVHLTGTAAADDTSHVPVAGLGQPDEDGNETSFGKQETALLVGAVRGDLSARLLTTGSVARPPFGRCSYLYAIQEFKS